MAAAADASLLEVVSLISAGELTAAEYAGSCIDRIEALDSEVGAFLHFDPPLARERATSCEGGKWSGLPLGVKDNIVTTGMATTCGSRMLEKFVSPVDATAVQRLRATGAFVVGKTNLDEFAMGSSTEHSAFGVTRNPRALDRVAGGSSGGSAAAVAAGMVPVALGSETGGSVRQPAAFCGVLGLKPTYGRISRSGLVAFASSLDQIGIVSRTVEDCAAVLQCIAGHDPADSTSSRAPVDDYEARLGGGVGGLRFGLIAETLEDLPATAGSALMETVRRIQNAGGIVERVSIPAIRLALAVYSVLSSAEASSNLSRFDGVRYGTREGDGSNLAGMFRRSRGEGFGAEVKRRIIIGTFALSSGHYDAWYTKAQKVRAAMTREFSAALARVDLLLTPTTPSPAFRIGEKLDDPLEMYLSDVYTAPANLVGVPAIAVPCGLSGEGLPLSVQFMSRHFDESTLLRVAKWMEGEHGPIRVAQLG